MDKISKMKHERFVLTDLNFTIVRHDRSVENVIPFGEHFFQDFTEGMHLFSQQLWSYVLQKGSSRLHGFCQSTNQNTCACA